MNRSLVQIGDLVEITQGCAFDSSLFGSGGDLPLIRIRDVVPGRSTTFLEGGCEARYLVHDGDLLIGMDGDFNRARWRGGRAALNQRVCRIRPVSEQLDEGYLFHMLPAELKRIEDETSFVTVKHLSVKQLRAIRLPLPSPEEQRRIAAILDQADALRAKRRAALSKIGEIEKTLFAQMFLHDAWPVAPLGTCCDLVRGSSPRPQGDPRFFGGSVPRLMISDITRDGMLVTPKTDSLTLEGAKRSRQMAAGSVVMAVSGAVGLPAILSTDACIHDGFVGFRALDPTILPVFLYHWLLHERAANSARGAGAIWINLTTDQVRRYDVPRPPLSLQNRFADALKAIDMARTQSMLARDLVDCLFAVLQHRAFTGAL